MIVNVVSSSPAGVEIALEGRLDTTSAPAAQEALMNAAKEYSNITLDFSKLVYVSSAGLRTLLTLQKQVNRTKGSLTLTNVAPAIMEVFEMTGFSSVLNIL